MKHTFTKVFTAAAVAGLSLSGCSLLGGDDDSSDGGTEDPVYAEMASWDACEVLDHLQPITDYMGIQGWGSISAQGGEPGSSKIGNTLDPDAMGCGSSIVNFGDNEGLGAGGELLVKLVPAESEEQAQAAYEERVASAESESSQGEEAETSEFTDPWDEGTIMSWTGSSTVPYTEVIARDGQWVVHIQLYHDQDYGLRGGGEPALAFTDDELRQWFVDTYLPEVNQTVNDRIAEVQ